MTLQQLEDTPSWEWPPEARSLLLATLRDEKAPESDRLIAADLAGDLVVMDDEVAAVLVDVLQSAAESPDVRASAAIALGPALEEADTLGFDEDGSDDGSAISRAAVERIQTALRRVYTDGNAPEKVRRKALEGSVRAPQPWHRDAVAAALASGNAAWTLTAVFCMRFVQGFEEQIVEALDSEDDEIFYQAVSAAGEWGVEEAWPYVTALLESDSTNKVLLLAAIEAAATIRPDEASEVLDHLLDSDDEDIVDAVGEALAMAEGLGDDDEEEEP
jgi:HEAT repeat protein